MSDAANAPTKIAQLPNGMAVWAFGFENKLPDADPAEARMFRALALVDAPSDPGFAAMNKMERDEELSSIAATIGRAAYHRRRFIWVTEEAKRRSEHFEGRVFCDQIAKYIGFEAASALNSARSTLDLVYHLAQRRAGIQPEDVDSELTKNIKNATAKRHNLPEVALLRGAHAAWFDELNDYRNAAVHCGAQEKLGYYPIASMSSWSRDPRQNVMLVPDRTSLRKPQPGKSYPMRTRPHEWTYARAGRLEALVDDAYKGLKAYCTSIGTQWGGAIPPRGLRDPEGAMIVAP